LEEKTMELEALEKEVAEREVRFFILIPPCSFRQSLLEFLSDLTGTVLYLGHEFSHLNLLNFQKEVALKDAKIMSLKRRLGAV
jgi:hypothetical protein